MVRSLHQRLRSGCLFGLILWLLCAEALAAGHSLRLLGQAPVPGDAVRIRLVRDDASGGAAPTDVGAVDFTIEFWLRGFPADNTASSFPCGSNGNWTRGNIVLDRDWSGSGRKYGVSLVQGRLAFGVVNDAGSTFTLCGSRSLLDGQWHHVALQRSAGTGALDIYVDGALDVSAIGPAGSVSLSVSGVAPGCGAGCDPFDRFLFVGSGRSLGGARLGFTGWVDDLRFSGRIRYSQAFQPVRLPLPADSSTAALFQFDEGTGSALYDALRVAVPSGNRPVASGRHSAETPYGLGAAVPAVLLEPMVSGLASPVEIVSVRDGTERLFVVEQGGRIRIVQAGALLPEPFLDISPLVISGSERGLLGLALHPNHAENGLFFINYTRAGDGATVIARYQRSPSNPNRADTNPANIHTLLIVPQDFENHNGGKLAFGPDGYLYIALGDGGSGNDPNNRAQSLNTRLGKLLRIDVNSGTAATPHYSVPSLNPFFGFDCTTACPEIWSLGLRNPWRFSFDRLTGDLFIGDVGQDNWEEIDFQPNGAPGGSNFGWKVMEGAHCNPTLNPACTPVGILPVLEYAHDQAGGFAVIGGYRYRGHRNLPLGAAYLFADSVSERIWSGRAQEDGSWEKVLLRDSSFGFIGNPSSFGEDEEGEIYLAGVSSGILYRVLSPDSDLDGLPDWWESAVAGTAAGGEATDDPDGDFLSNRAEYQAGRNPLYKDNDVFSDAKLFVQQQYRDWLLREGEPGGRAFWTGALRGVGLTRSAVVEAFTNSPEFEGGAGAVANLYYAFFLRAPDPGGLRFWTATLRMGSTLAQIAQTFANSPEFFARYGQLPDAQYVDLLYRNVLGRNAEPGGLAFWETVLARSERTRGDVAVALLQSDEYKTNRDSHRLAIYMYAFLLKRTAEDGGVDHWAAIASRSGPMTALEGFLNSSEYRARFLP